MIIDIRKVVSDSLDNALDIMIKGAQRELNAQGHSLTGNLINSFTKDIKIFANSMQGDIYAARHGDAMDTGIKSYKIPYERGSGAKVSKFIDALINYWTKRGLGTIEAKRAAFATANVQKREGMPTRASYRFSRNGRRTQWKKHTIDATQNNISKAFDLLKSFQIQLDNFLNDGN